MKRRQFIKTLAAFGMVSLAEKLWPKSASAANLQVGRATGAWTSFDTLNANIDLNVGFTPTAGQFICIVMWSGRSESTDAVGGITYQSGMGWAVSSSSRQGVNNYQADAAAGGAGRAMYDDSVIKLQEVSAGAVIASLDFVGAITNGVRFIVDDVIPSPGISFECIVIDGLADVGLFTITEPAGSAGSAPGNTTHSGAGVDTADLFLIISADAADLTIPAAISGAGYFHIGAANSSGQFLISQTTGYTGGFSLTNSYATHLECAGRVLSNDTVRSRGSFVAATSDGLTINWLEIGAAQTKYFCAALKGIDAKVASALTLTNTSTDIDVTGLSHTCLGGLVFSIGKAESTQDTTTAGLILSMGSFNGASQGSHAVSSVDNVTPTQAAAAVQYGDVYATIVSDAIDATMQMTTLLSNGARFRMTDAEASTQKWFGTVLFADAGLGAAPKLFFRRRRGN